MANTNDNSNNQDLPPPPDGTNTPNPAEEDIDAQLNALECEPFTEEEVHQMMQKIRVRILMEKLRARDQAMIDLMQFLSLPGQEPASDTMPAAGFRGAAASSNAIATSRLESRLSSGPPVVPTETGIDKSPFSRSTEACKRRRPDPKPRKKGWVPNKAIVSLILGMAVISNVVWSQAFRTQTNHGKKEAQRVAASRLITEEIVKAQCLIEGPQLLPLPRRVNAKQQEMLQNTLVIFLNFINKNFDDPFLKKDRAETQYWAANIYLHLAEYEKAKACFPQAIAMLRELAAEQRSIPQLQRSLAECYLNYGVILARLEPSDHLQAERVLGQALTQWHKLQGKYPDDTTYKLGLAAAHNAIGELFIDTRRPDEAEKSYRQAAEFLEEVVKDLPPQSPQRSWLANHHQNRGKLLVATNQLRQARHEYEKALEILAELPRDCPNISEYRNDLATQFNLLGNEFVHEKDMREAEGSYGQARKIMEALVADFPSVGKYHTNLGVAIHQLGSLAYEVGNNPKARRLAIQAIECQQKAVALEPLSVSAKKALRDSWIHRATVAIHQRNHWEAAWAARNLAGIISDNFEDQKRAATFLSRSVDLAESDCTLWPILRTPLAHIYAGHVKFCLEKLEQSSPGPYSWENEMAWFLATSPTLRFRDPPRAVKLAMIAVDKNPRNGAYKNTLGVALYRNGQYKEAVDVLKESTLVRDGGDICDWFFLAMANWKLHDRAQARSYYAMGLEWMKKNALDDELQRFHDEVANLIPQVDSLTLSKEWKSMLKMVNSRR